MPRKYEILSPDKILNKLAFDDALPYVKSGLKSQFVDHEGQRTWNVSDMERLNDRIKYLRKHKKKLYDVIHSAGVTKDIILKAAVLDLDGVNICNNIEEFIYDTFDIKDIDSAYPVLYRYVWDSYVTSEMIALLATQPRSAHISKIDWLTGTISEYFRDPVMKIDPVDGILIDTINSRLYVLLNYLEIMAEHAYRDKYPKGNDLRERVEILGHVLSYHIETMYRVTMTPPEMAEKSRDVLCPYALRAEWNRMLDIIFEHEK